MKKKKLVKHIKSQLEIAQMDKRKAIAKRNWDGTTWAMAEITTYLKLLAWIENNS